MSNEVFQKTLLPDIVIKDHINAHIDTWRIVFVLNELVSLFSFFLFFLFFERVSTNSIIQFNSKNELVSLVTFIREQLENCFHIWSLLAFGDRESWSKLFTIGPLMGIKKPLGFWKNESLFLINNDGQLLLYDSSTQEMTSLQVDGLPLQMITYVESLISFKGGNDLEEKGNS